MQIGNEKLFDNLRECGIKVWDVSKVLYKYADLETAKIILENSTLKFSQYSNFNDPFELIPHLIDFSFTKKDIEVIAAKVRSIKNRSERREVTKRAFSDSKTLTNYYIEDFKNENGRYGISCFSKNPLNNLMWSHYAHKHTGVCLGFKFYPQEFLFILTVNYSPQIKKFNYFKHKFESILYPIFTKFPEWSYEEEVRVVNMRAPGFGRFNESNLCELYYGFNTPQNGEREIERLLKLKNYDIGKKIKVDLNPSNLRLRETQFKNDD